MGKSWWLATVLLAALLLGCGGGAGPDTPVSSDGGTPVEAPADGAGDEAMVRGEAQVESVELRLLESFPLQVHATVRGFVGDGCTSLGGASQTRDGNRILVSLPTFRPAGANCTQQLQGFEQVIPLDVVGLPAGEYVVTVNDMEATFILPQDNGPAEPVEEGAGDDLGLADTDCPVARMGETLVRTARYCLLVPEYASAQESQAEPALTISGTAYGEGPEPARAMLMLMEVGDERALDEVVAELTTPLLEQGSSISTAETTLDGVPLVVVEGLPGRMGNRQAFARTDQGLLAITLMPVDSKLPEATAEAETLWSYLLDSFRWLP